MSKYLDENGLLYAWTKTKTLLAGKVDTVSGKGLSTNDYTTAEKTKLEAIEAGAAVNVIEAITVNGTAVTPTNKVANVTVPTNNNELTNGAGYQTSSDVSSAIDTAVTITSVKVNGSALTPSNKAVDISVPTNNNELTNGAGYQTASDVNTAISTALAGVSGLSYETVEELPASGEAGVIYLLPNGESSGTNIYDEYIYINGGFEKIGTTDVDLSDYLQTSATISNAEIDTIFAS